MIKTRGAGRSRAFLEALVEDRVAEMDLDPFGGGLPEYLLLGRLGLVVGLINENLNVHPAHLGIRKRPCAMVGSLRLQIPRRISFFADAIA